jgi:hypothetical protein
MKIQTSLLISIALTSCAVDSSKSSKTWIGGPKNSPTLKVDLVGVDTKNMATSEFDQYYRIDFLDTSSLYVVPSHLNREDVAESFSKTESFGGSSIHFSLSGKTVVIDDDSPGAASSDGHKIILGTQRDRPIVATLVGPERPGILIEDWPIVTSVSDYEVTFQYEDDKDSFSVSIDNLLQNAKKVEQDADGNPH